MNNYNYFNYDWYRNGNRSDNFFPNRNNNYQTQNLYSPKEGFEKGNMFEDLYSPYKNHRPTNLRANSEQERKLINLQAISFATHDLNLYLDLHPEDQSLVTLFNDYRRQKEELTKEYEESYGPMTVSSDVMEKNTFQWANSPWPWEGNNV